jgi:F-type H+-transporting ATPase subunit epsilon
MPLTFHVDIVSSEEEIFSGTAHLLVAPTVRGEVGILARHAPLLARLKPGLVRVQREPDYDAASNWTKQRRARPSNTPSRR